MSHTDLKSILIYGHKTKYSGQNLNRPTRCRIQISKACLKISAYLAIFSLLCEGKSEDALWSK